MASALWPSFAAPIRWNLTGFQGPSARSRPVRRSGCRGTTAKRWAPPPGDELAESHGFGPPLDSLGKYPPNDGLRSRNRRGCFAVLRRSGPCGNTPKIAVGTSSRSGIRQQWVDSAKRRGTDMVLVWRLARWAGPAAGHSKRDRLRQTIPPERR